MSVANKSFSQIITLTLAINMNGVTTLEDITWIRTEYKDWMNNKLSFIGL